jgi:Cellulase (glycosyl hydrolase family 5)
MSGDSTDYSSSQNPSSPYASATSSDTGYSPSQSTGNGYSNAASSPGGYSQAQDQQSVPASQRDNSSQIIGNGVNLQPSYSENGDVDLGWELMKSIPAIKTVRLEIESFAVDAAVRWIEEANDRGYKVIATYHNYEAIKGDRSPDYDPYYMGLAAEFWSNNYAKLRSGGPFLINVMNEWGHKTITAKNYASLYNDSIREIRLSCKYNDPLILDLPGSGQLARVAADAVTGAGGISPIADKNIVLSMHVYPITWNGKTSLKQDDVALLVKTGYPCMIGEFGESFDTPNTDWRGIVTYAKANNWPVLAWAWDGDGRVMNIMWPEFLKFKPGPQNSNYKINRQYADIVLPFLS